jgi:low temperature requirement protein LtrA
MTTDRGTELLRSQRSPQRATFLELFFDLVYVFALTRVSQRLIDDLTSHRRILLSELGQTVLLLLALWMLWSLTAWATSQYDPRRPAIQMVVVGSMFGSMVMAVSLPEAFDKRGISFAVAYVAVQVGRPLFLTLAMRGHPQQHVAAAVLFWAAISAVPWIAGALAHDRARGVLWTLAVATDYGAARLGWPTPRLGRSPASGWTIAGEHLAERYQQFMIIALGESILVTGATFSSESVNAARSAAFLVAFTTTVLLWRIYFYRAGEVLADAVEASPHPARLGQSATFTHLFMVASLVATAVGYELVIRHPLGHTDPAWIAVIVGGPALFVAARARFEYEVFSRVSWSRVIGLVALAAMAPALVLVSPLTATVAASAILAGIASADAIRARERPSGPPTPPL